MIKRITFNFLLQNTAIARQLITTVPLYSFSADDSNGSSSKKYSSSFKIRSRLAEFFKHIHPDQMNQAPVKYHLKFRQKLKMRICALLKISMSTSTQLINKNQFKESFLSFTFQRKLITKAKSFTHSTCSSHKSKAAK